MEIYFAPMEGITGYIYRNAFNEYFGGIDKYFSPFISPATGKSLKMREIRDVSTEKNVGIKLVPQILTNDREGFLRTIDNISKTYGYKEFNINAGCPSGTVVAKKKGAGILRDTEKLDKFLYEIFADNRAKDIKISVKTRLGMYEPEEFYRVLEVYNKYPLSELIVHARVQTDYYKNKPRIKMFEWALKNSNAPVCYNGDIFSKDDYDRIKEIISAGESILKQDDRLISAGESLKKTDGKNNSVMLGRGLIANPALALEIKYGKKLNMEVVKNMHNRLVDGYLEIMSGERDVMFKMKELWSYMADMFEDCDRYIKTIRKTVKFSEYQSAVNAIFSNCAIKENGHFTGGA